DYIEMFYNPIRRHSHNNGLSPIKYEMQFNQKLASV
ncbi:IS3 family transposase, partial [Orrella sp. NBD-18]